MPGANGGWGENVQSGLDLAGDGLTLPVTSTVRALDTGVNGARFVGEGETREWVLRGGIGARC
jgi:hypothetical protein